jgi:hypothetical protein
MIALVLFYFFFILFFSLIKTPKIENSTVNLFKALFPSWKFFDESADTPVLLFRLVNEEEWRICVPHPQKHWYHLFYNPEGNLYLAYHSHIQQLLGELTNASELESQRFHEHISYNICEHFVRSRSLSSDFQFKISNIQIEKKGFIVLDDILISPVLKSGDL